MRSSRRSIAVKKLKSGFSSKVTDNEIAIFKYKLLLLIVFKNNINES